MRIDAHSNFPEVAVSDLIPLREVAIRLNINMSTLWRWRKVGRFPPVIIYTRRKQYVSQDDLAHFEKGLRDH